MPETATFRVSKTSPAPLSLVARNGCRRQLSWQCDFSPHSLVYRLPAALIRLGFVDESRCTWIREFTGPEEDQFVIVPATGRVELRIHYLTPQHDRTARAQRLGDLLAQVLLEPHSSPSRTDSDPELERSS